MISNRNSRNLKLDQITLDKNIQPRVVIQKQIIINYWDSYLQGDKFPNVTVFFDGKKYWLADGWHRYFAVQLAKFADIGCDVIDGTYRDALCFSLSANRTHGKNNNLKDKHRIVMSFVNNPETCHMGVRETNRASGLPMQSISNILLDIAEQKTEKILL